MDLPERITDIVDAFEKFPGIGKKTALRYALHLTDWPDENIEHFSRSLAEIKNLEKCVECGLFAEGGVCSICSSSYRGESGFLCVVESITDCLSIERGGCYNGLYHILGGVLNPLLGIGPDRLHLRGLADRSVRRRINNIILALNPTVEGDATCAYIRGLLPETVKVDRIGFGIPIGGSLEYLDPMTISKALENRQEMS